MLKCASFRHVLLLCSALQTEAEKSGVDCSAASPQEDGWRSVDDHRKGAKERTNLKNRWTSSNWTRFKQKQQTAIELVGRRRRRRRNYCVIDADDRGRGGGVTALTPTPPPPPPTLMCNVPYTHKAIKKKARRKTNCTSPSSETKKLKSNKTQKVRSAAKMKIKSPQCNKKKLKLKAAIGFQRLNIAQTHTKKREKKGKEVGRGRVKSTADGGGE